MNIKILQQYKKWISDELNACLDFWLLNGIDGVHGGVYTCLDRAGKLYSTDKSVWMQGRCAWLFAHLCNVYGIRPEWRAASESCIDFLERHCINHGAGGRLYFTVTEDGKPLRQRRYLFSEAFYIIANAEYALAFGSEEHLRRARKYYDFIYDIKHSGADPVAMGAKTTRKLRSLADPMIYLNVSNVMRRCDPANAAVYSARAEECVGDIFRFHHRTDLRCTLETVGENGEFFDRISAGRVVNPGHSIECSWFLMEEANYRNDAELYSKAVQIFDFAIAKGWDKRYGGILYYVDVCGMPPEAYEHDMKLWWPHNEAVIAALKIFSDTGSAEHFEWFERVAGYCKAYFCDPEYGEWYGYLRRDGEPTQPPCKGSTFKGPFHLPRMLVTADKLLEQIMSRT